MNIVIHPELQSHVDPLTDYEFEALERSLLAEGCRDALVLWGEVLVDGHNRYVICQKHGIPYQTVQNDKFSNIEDVLLWMIDNHLGRRSVSDFQRGALALRKREILLARAAALGAASATAVATEEAAAEVAPRPLNKAKREDLAKAAGVSANTIGQIEKIQKTAAPELMAAVRSGVISINAAAAVASLPAEKQAAAASGGKKELQQAARQVRDNKPTVRASKKADMAEAALQQPAAVATLAVTAPQTDSAALQLRLHELSAENEALKAQVAALSAELEQARRAA